MTASGIGVNTIAETGNARLRQYIFYLNLSDSRPHCFSLPDWSIGKADGPETVEQVLAPFGG